MLLHRPPLHTPGCSHSSMSANTQDGPESKPALEGGPEASFPETMNKASVGLLEGIIGSALGLVRPCVPSSSFLPGIATSRAHGSTCNFLPLM